MYDQGKERRKREDRGESKAREGERKKRRKTYNKGIEREEMRC